MVKASIILPILNAESTLKICIESLINQDIDDKKIDYEIIAIDNGSSDNSVKILDEFRDSIIVLTEDKKGPAAARNKGVKAASGDIFLFIDSDCIASKNWISNMLIAFDDKNVMMAAGRVLPYNAENAIQKYQGFFVHTQKVYTKAGFFATANAAIRKEIMEDFDERFLWCEDVELCRRIVKGQRIEYVEDAIVKHYYSSAIINFITKMFHFGQYQARVIKLYGNRIKSKRPSYLSVCTQYGIIFCVIKLMQDIAFICGHLSENIRR